jgi:DNA-binding response OmpR family regulator
LKAVERPRVTILLVEDDPALADLLIERLGRRAYCVWHATNAAEAEEMVDEVHPDLIIVDLLLPDTHGLLLCANLRERQAAPIIICSGTTRKEDPVLGFKLWADDFIAKPFSVDELEVRIERVLRKPVPRDTAPAARPATVQRIGDLVIDQARCRVTRSGEVVHLTPTEYRLLCVLAGRPDHVLARRELAEEVWGCYDTGVARSLDVHMRRLRAKLREGVSGPPRLVNARGFGYQLVSEPEGEVVSRS